MTLSTDEKAAAYTTLLHVLHVQSLMLLVLSELQTRMVDHDRSKIEHPEIKLLSEHSSTALKNIEYWSDEYKQALNRIKPALDHHYRINRHHPEHHENGIEDMTLIDLLEMLCDWLASTKLMANGDIEHSLKVQQCRFGISDQLMHVLKNTVCFIEESRNEKT